MRYKNKDLLKAMGYILLIIASAYASFNVPVTASGIPFTLQSLVVFVVAAFMRPGMALGVVGAYLLIGFLGFPVFAEGTSGWNKITGGSGGFLYGFLICAFLIAQTIKMTNKRTFLFFLQLYLISTIVLFASGIIHLTILYDINTALDYGFNPFWQVGIIKAILAALFVFLWIKHDICAKLKNKILA